MNDHKRMNRGRGEVARGFTLVELLVVVSIISLLAAILMPAIYIARESARKAKCQSNLRQFGLGFHQQVDRLRGALCTGAFDWRRDGSVTEIGWVADLVNNGSPVGEMLCPSNPYVISEAYIDLLAMEPEEASGCVDMLGRPSEVAPDGELIINPCRQILESKLAALSEPRRILVETKVFFEHYNTNYTASWFFVRSEALLGSNGNLGETVSGCGVGLKLRNSTRGPLKVALVDSSGISGSVIPLLGDGAAAGPLPQRIGDIAAGEPTVQSFTNGPVQNPSMDVPTFSGGTVREGPNGWWSVWARSTLQDYRGFGPVHKGTCNILFADGSVRSFRDVNGDGALNNGFDPSTSNGFRDSQIEVPERALASRYSLIDAAIE